MKLFQPMILSGVAILAIGLAACSSPDEGASSATTSPAATASASATIVAAEATASPGEAYAAAVTEILDRLSAVASEVAAVMAQADITSDAWRQRLIATLVPFEGLADEVLVLGDPAGFEAVHARLLEATGAFAQGALSFGRGVEDSDLDALERAADELAFGATAVTEVGVLLQTALADGGG
ncbi:MAG: hypothetical protein V3R95_05730 [Dehalococcoidia bacterium]